MTRTSVVPCLAACITLAFALTSSAQAPAGSAVVSKSANPELVSHLATELGISPQQAEGAAGALFNLAKSRLTPQEWSALTAAVPGMKGLLAAVPATPRSGPMSAVALETTARLNASLGAAEADFARLGLAPQAVNKAVPVLGTYASRMGGNDSAAFDRRAEVARRYQKNEAGTHTRPGLAISRGPQYRTDMKNDFIAAA